MRVDVREIDLQFDNAFRKYSLDEVELFKVPSKFKHFRKRILLLKRRSEANTLFFLPLGDGNLYKSLKLYVLNLLPTQNEKLTMRVYGFLHKVFGQERINEITKNYAKYMAKYYPNRGEEDPNE